MRKSTISPVIILVLGLIFLAPIKYSFAETTYVTISARGSGEDREVAIKSALKEAVARVNGVSIKAKSTLETIEKTRTTDKKDKFNFDKDFKKSITDETQGVVKEYNIIDEGKESSGLYFVKINATIAKFEVSSTANRRRIAVIPFRSYVKNSSINQSDGIRKFNQSLNNYIVQTRKFTVLDREYNKEINNELNNLSQSSKVEDQVKIGQQLFADYIILGSFEKLDIKQVEKKYISSNKIFKRTVGEVSLNYRVIDVPTKQIKFSGSYNKQLRLKSNDQNIDSLVNILSKQIGSNIMFSIYPILIENIKDNNVYLGQGGNQIKIGDIYNIYEYLNEKIVDSYTGENLGNLESKIGQIKITQNSSKFSIGEILEIKKDIKKDFKVVKYFVKPADQNDVQLINNNVKTKGATNDKW